ncbi:hypothetical protein [Agromyces sp. NPDC049794]|uniref:hypothetical protein n=1 Tax=unclassified Agromyces TaxID=2639701 RepID=UPI00340B9252
MEERRGIRITLLLVQAFVALTSIAGGIALIMGAVDAEFTSVLNPPGEELADSPFGSYVLPGVVLAVVLGGLHVLAFAMLSRRMPRALFWSAAAGFATLIWIFVQMIFIPFSVLQAVYFVLGLVELGFVMLVLGLLRRRV